MEDIDERYSKAFSEVFCVMNNLSSELYELIPTTFVKLVKENRDKNYNVDSSYIRLHGMMPETRGNFVSYLSRLLLQ